MKAKKRGLPGDKKRRPRPKPVARPAPAREPLVVKFRDPQGPSEVFEGDVVAEYRKIRGVWFLVIGRGAEIVGEFERVLVKGWRYEPKPRNLGPIAPSRPPGLTVLPGGQSTC